MGKITIPIGPQHPLLKEPIAFTLTAEGEQVVDSTMRMGYVHRGIERLAQERSYTQITHLVERVCGICSHVHTTTYCQGVEELLGLEVPPRGLYIRALLCELERIHSHLLWLGVLANNVGMDTLFMYAWRDREIVLDIMEELSGGRVSHAVNVIGGVRIDFDEARHQMVVEQLERLAAPLREHVKIVENERTLKARTQNIGHLSAEQMREYCVVGPVARASGIDVDIRRDIPRPPYTELDFDVITHTDGDVWARTVVRVEETLVSLKLCQDILAKLPDGPVAVNAKRRVPAGEVVSRTEAPRGEVVYYIRSNGTDKPERLKIRTPTLTCLITLPIQLQGVALADVSVVLSGVDLCIACADR